MQVLPKISIVMPSYNQAEFIDEAIKSILSQSYSNYELVIVDGLSTDGTIEILQKYRGHEKIKQIIIEKDNGQVDALIKGFNLCAGDIFAWLNSDDIYLPNALQKVANTFAENEIDVLNGEVNFIDKNSAVIGRFKRKKAQNKKWYNYPQMIAQQGTFFSEKIYKQIGGLNKDYAHCMDYDLFFRFAINNAKFYFIDEILAEFRLHDNSKTVSLPYKMWKEEFKIFYRLSKGKIFSLFYYWKLRGILSTIIRGNAL